jgi:hypothetical protein
MVITSKGVDAVEPVQLKEPVVRVATTVQPTGYVA